VISVRWRGSTLRNESIARLQDFDCDDPLSRGQEGAMTEAMVEFS